MDDVKEFINSGILEVYILGQASGEEAQEVERMCALHEEVRHELDNISMALEEYGRANAIQPDPTIEPFLMARIDYMERLKDGEEPSFPPLLHEGSKIADYAQWLKRPDLQLSTSLDNVLARIIGYTPQVTTAIVWLEHGAPPEVHTTEYEKFLVVEGSCDITIDNKVHKMEPGDVLTIPLHLSHNVRVTSSIPCKVILQRIAA